MTQSLLLALGATLSFSSASLIFTRFARSVSVLWVNVMKAAVALTLLAITVPFLRVAPANGALLANGTLNLLASGALGLGIGDLFLFGAFVRIGPSRTLMLYGFQPLVLGMAAAILFGQPFDLHRLTAIAFLIGCLFVFSLERYRETRSWEVRGLVLAVIGVAMDSGGVLLSRFAFEQSPEMHPLEGHLIRCAGALVAYAVLAAGLKIKRRTQTPPNQTPVIGLVENFRRFDGRSRALILFGCFLGTYLSLCFYLTAVKSGHLASVSAIAITGPMFAALLEAIIERKKPSRYLLTAFALFIAGFLILLG